MSRFDWKKFSARWVHWDGWTPTWVFKGKFTGRRSLAIGCYITGKIRIRIYLLNITLKRDQIATYVHSMICVKIMDRIFKGQKCFKNVRIVYSWGERRFVFTCILLFGCDWLITNWKTGTYVANELQKIDDATYAAQEKATGQPAFSISFICT